MLTHQRLSFLDVHGYSYCVPGEGVAIPPTYTVPPLPHFHYPYYLHHTSYPQPAPYTPCPSPIPVQPIYYPPPPSPAPAPNVSANSTARSTPSPSTNASEHVRQLIAASFGATVFKKVPLPSVNPTKPHLWYLQSTVEARLWVILNCIKAAGFKSFGEFLVAMFSEKHSSHPTVIKTVSSFVRGDSKAGTRPVDVVRLLYENPHSGKLRTPSAGDIVFPSLPRHALPPALRLLEAPDVPESSTTRNDLLDWALARVLVRVDEEVKILLDPLHGIASRTQAVTWSMLYSYSLTEKQDVIARNAPALFAVIASAATSEDAREKLRLSVSGRLAETDSSRAGPPQPNTELPQGESGVADEDETDPPVVGSTRDIWLVREFQNMITAPTNLLHILGYYSRNSHPSRLPIPLCKHLSEVCCGNIVFQQCTPYRLSNTMPSRLVHLLLSNAMPA